MSQWDFIELIHVFIFPSQRFFRISYILFINGIFEFLSRVKIVYNCSLQEACSTPADWIKILHLYINFSSKFVEFLRNYTFCKINTRIWDSLIFGFQPEDWFLRTFSRPQKWIFEIFNLLNVISYRC